MRGWGCFLPGGFPLWAHTTVQCTYTVQYRMGRFRTCARFSKWSRWCCTLTVHTYLFLPVYAAHLVFLTSVRCTFCYFTSVCCKSSFSYQCTLHILLFLPVYAAHLVFLTSVRCTSCFSYQCTLHILFFLTVYATHLVFLTSVRCTYCFSY